jgi:hypothetical protein
MRDVLNEHRKMELKVNQRKSAQTKAIMLLLNASSVKFELAES